MTIIVFLAVAVAVYFIVTFSSEAEDIVNSKSDWVKNQDE